MNDEMMMSKDDVVLEELPPRECEDCADPATLLLSLDLRTNGETIGIGVFCKDCGEQRQRRIQDGLPAVVEQGSLR